MQLTNQQKALLRSQPHKTNLFLSIYRPQTELACRVNGAFGVGETEIDFDSTTSGSWTQAYADMTVLIGTQAGLDDIGRLRLRSITSSQAVFAENSIVWADDLHLTFLSIVDIQAIYPKIIQDPNQQTNVIFYKDENIPYSNQNSIYGTFPCAGPHRAGFLDSGTGTAYYSATGTYNPLGDSVTYSWAFEGGTPTGSTALTPGTVRYSTPGHYITRLIVTSSAGAVDTTYRYVSIYDRPEQGTNVPTLKWELKDLSGSRAEGGYTATIKVFENLGDIEPNAIVVIFSDDWYGGTRVSLGGNAINNEKIVFVGYVLRDSIKFNYKESSIEFDVGSVAEVMKETEGFSVSCESKALASTWFELTEMTVTKAIYHYLRWHSTILKTTDFQYTGDDRLVQYFDADRGSLYDSIDNFIRNSLLGELVSDRQGKLWAEISSFGMERPFTLPSYFTFHKQDWMGDPGIEERRNSELSFIELGGIAYYGVSSNTFSALLSNAPTITPLYHGKSNNHEGLILLSQQQLNQVAGNYLAHHNTKFPEISAPLVGNYRNLDIAPQERLYLVIDSNDTVRGKSLQDLPYRLMSMDWNYDPKNESFLPSVSLQQIATGTAGQTVLIPPTPPDEGYSTPGFNLPPYYPFDPPGTVGPTVSTRVLMHDPSVGILYSEDFDAVSPNWRTINFGLTAAQYQSINEMFVTPSGAFYVGYTKNSLDGNFIARAPFVGGTFTVIYDGVNGIRGVGYNPLVQDYICAVINVASSSDQYLFAGSGGNLVQGGVPNIGFGSERSPITFGDGKWMGCTYDAFQLFAENGLSVSSSSILSGLTPMHKRAATTGKTFHARNGAAGIVLGEGNLTTSTIISDADMNSGVFVTNMAVEDTGALLMAVYGAGGKGKSSDGGFSFGLLPNLPPGGAYAFAYGGSGGEVFKTKWIAARGVVRFSPDFGNTWLNKEGNITTVVPFPVIDKVVVI